MGNAGDKIKNFFTNDVGGFFTKTIPNAFKSAGTGFYEKILRPTYDKVLHPLYDKVAAPIIDKGVGLVGKVGDFAGKTIDNAGKVEDAATGALGGIGSFLSNPLYLIVGGIVAVALVSKVLDGRKAANG